LITLFEQELAVLNNECDKLRRRLQDSAAETAAFESQLNDVKLKYSNLQDEATNAASQAQQQVYTAVCLSFDFWFVDIIV
jgi:septal ring factor EnvC (AmiA/AmiB activator)